MSRVSIASDGTEGNGDSLGSTISADGRYAGFYSAANNLVPDDTNGVLDVFVHDRQTGQTSRVSVASDGTQGNGDSRAPVISADGRYMTFYSLASNLALTDTNGTLDVFVHDLQTGETSHVSVASDGSGGNNQSYYPTISADGRYVAFHSLADNLVPGDTNSTWDIFLHDLQTGQTSRVSVASDGTQGNGESRMPTVSADGRYLVFQSLADNLVAGDTNVTWDIFVHDRLTGETSRVSIASDGTQGNNWSRWSSISADGLYVTFYSSADNLVAGDTNGIWDGFVHDRLTGETSLISVASDGTQANGESFAEPAISGDGRFVAFNSSASNLVPGDTNGVNDIFLHDRQTEETSLMSAAVDGTGANLTSWYPFISPDGRYVVFDSEASNLVPDDTNGARDVFVRDRGEQEN